MGHETVSADGSFSWENGVDSQAVTTIQSALTPNGLQRNQLAWMVNATVRGGGILQRTGWQINTRVTDGSTLFQGGIMYEPIDGVTSPYPLLLIGGHLYQVKLDGGGVTDLSVKYGVFLPATVDQAFFVQAEEFVVIQSGDGLTLPLFWDGGMTAGGFGLRKSIGITTPVAPPNTPGVNEIPAATAMDYYMNRLWYAQGRSYAAGDIVKGNSGTAPYNKRDSVLEVTENPLAFTGDNFFLPDSAGNIRALKHSSNLDVTLGQGQLFIFTRKAVYAQTVPVTRANWIGTTSSNGPLQTVALLNNGAVNDRSIVATNGDLYFQSLEPSIRSLFQSRKEFGQFGNVPISRNENRILRFNNRALMRFSSGILFDNRVWQTVLPQTGGKAGVTHQAVIPLDFDIISSFQAQLPPAWEGHYEGIDILQLFVGDFGGLERAFAAAVSRIDGSIEVWELTISSRTENGDNRVAWSADFPAFTWGKEFEQKELQAAEIWIDKEFGTVDFTLNFRSDADPCWHLWAKTSFCVARSCAEDVNTPVCYPIGPTYREGYCFPLTFPKPNGPCAPDACNKRPADIGHQFQVQIIVKGWCRIRGLILYASKHEKDLYENLVQVPTGILLTPTAPLAIAPVNPPAPPPPPPPTPPKQNPIITWANPSDITYPTPLS